jgi:nucleotide-binding universal stress UspA family protein
MQTNTLIALVDGSAYAESVCHHAAWIAGRTGAKVKLFHVMGRRSGPEHQDLSGAIRLGARSRLLEELSELDVRRAKLAQEHGRAILEDARAIVEADGDIEVETRLRQGDLVETITEKEDSGDMIVIGKRGEAAGLASEHLGSNLERIVRASHKPVFVANRKFRDIERVLVAFDGASSSLKAVDFISRSSLFAGLAVTLVYAGARRRTCARRWRMRLPCWRQVGFSADWVIQPGVPEKVLVEMACRMATTCW